MVRAHLDCVCVRVCVCVGVCVGVCGCVCVCVLRLLQAGCFCEKLATKTKIYKKKYIPLDACRVI